jgi:CTD small phosphatase-like protein 2
MSKVFELGVFTASIRFYAEQVVQHLDPEGKYIRMVLTREHCVEAMRGLFIKDLRIIRNFEINRIFLVDNCSHSYAFQPDNGVPIINYWEGTQDRELSELKDYLMFLLKQPDPLAFNRDYFKTRLMHQAKDLSTMLQLLPLTASLADS